MGQMHATDGHNSVLLLEKRREIRDEHDGMRDKDKSGIRNKE